MFHNQWPSQKSTEALYTSFGDVHSDIDSAIGSENTNFFHNNFNGSSLHQRMNINRGCDDREGQDLPTQAPYELWDFTTSLMNSNYPIHAKFANQDPAYLTSIQERNNTVSYDRFSNQYIQETGKEMDMIMPPEDLHGYPAKTLELQGLDDYNLFERLLLCLPGQLPQSTSALRSVEAHGDEFVMDDSHLSNEMNNEPLFVTSSSQEPAISTSIIPFVSLESFRFHVGLYAPTAIINQVDGKSITYLDKGQVYSVSIFDTEPAPPGAAPILYRTAFRISFKDEQQRRAAGKYWQLWKERCNNRKVLERCIETQAVEYIDPNQFSVTDNVTSTVELSTASFDGFSILWTAETDNRAKCNVNLRFNFLSTDFSYSKGVEGAICRLYAKTEVVSSDSAAYQLETPEICFCEVKLFRQNGAERKRQTDIARAEIVLDKLKRQIARTEAGSGGSGKRKEQAALIRNEIISRRDRTNKRTSWISMPSSRGKQTDTKQDLRMKMQRLQDNYTSRQPITAFCLRGHEQDDPDIHPILLEGEYPKVTKVESTGSNRPISYWSSSIDGKYTLLPSSLSSGLSQPQEDMRSRLNSSGVIGSMTSTGLSEIWPVAPQLREPQYLTPQHSTSLSDQPTKVQRLRQHSARKKTNWIEVLEVDSSYSPPLNKQVKPVTYFYVLHQALESSNRKEPYRAVYLMHGGVKDLVASIAAKYGIEPSRIFRTVHISKNDPPTKVDDDFVCRIPKGQEMALDFSSITMDPRRRERDWTGEAGLGTKGFHVEQALVESAGHELRLMF